MSIRITDAYHGHCSEDSYDVVVWLQQEEDGREFVCSVDKNDKLLSSEESVDLDTNIPAALPEDVIASVIAVAAAFRVSSATKN